MDEQKGVCRNVQIRKARLVCIALLIGAMVLLSVGSFCGQHYMTHETPPKQPAYFLDYVRDVYILREVDND